MGIQKNINERPPAVAGQFYPSDSAELKAMIDKFFEAVNEEKGVKVKAIIAPHAGYIYSGQSAAKVYQCIRNQANTITRVVLLGPSHRVGFDGIATTTATKYQMPFGSVRIDRQAVDTVNKLPQVNDNNQAHAFEHSLEVQIPFLQMVLNDFSLVPLVVGDCEADKVAEVIELLWGGEETLFVISSDLSHFKNYPKAQQQDQHTAHAILNYLPDDIHRDDACGRNPIKGLLVAAKKYQLKPQLVDLCNSGDTAGDKDRVVGYGAFIF